MEKCVKQRLLQNTATLLKTDHFSQTLNCYHTPICLIVYVQCVTHESKYNKNVFLTSRF